MTIFYSLVARGAVVLVEFNEKKGNFPQISQQILDKMPSSNTKVSYKHDEYMFHILVSNGLTYLCMAEREFGNRIPFRFLDDVEKKFVAAHGEAAKNALSMSLNSSFKKVLKGLQDHHNNTQNDSISSAKGKIDEVKGVMIANIDKVLERGDQLDQLVVRTDELTNVSTDFRVKAKKLKNTMWWKNVKLLLILLFIIFIIICAIVWFVCGFPVFQNCRAWFGGK
jgi:vesicle-associated membrane protein 7